ncbi:hypothetical protein ACLB2K_062054 [Fragaria x ananassa]
MVLVMEGEAEMMLYGGGGCGDGDGGRGGGDGMKVAVTAMEVEVEADPEMVMEVEVVGQMKNKRVAVVGQTKKKKRRRRGWQVHDIALSGLISEQWKELGWQGPNPSTDFRSCGVIALENLIFFARTYPASFRRLLFKQGGRRATWEYPFAVAGINISFMLIQLLDLWSAFEMVDAQWLAMNASYMQFNDVLQATRTQLERELSLEDTRGIQDLPAYNLLCQ